MAAKKKSAPKTATPVESYEHDDKRKNIPTADNAELVTPEVEQVTQLRYPRNPDLDPQLVWKGKDEQDAQDLSVDVPPIYVQEKIDPRVLIENLRDTAGKDEEEPEYTLFDGFDGFDGGGLDAVDFYKHEFNWSNRMILGDSLQTMASLAEREALRGKVQMIYMDPPYGIKFGSNWQVSMRNRTVKDSQEGIAREVEVVKAFRDTWELGINSYLTYLRDRLVAARDLLTDSGSFFMQIGDENVHLVRGVMDEVFGSGNFISLITFKKASPLGSNGLAGVTDFLIWYAKDATVVKQRPLFKAKSSGLDSFYSFVELTDGLRRSLQRDEREGFVALPAGSRIYRTNNLLSAGYTTSCFYDFEFEGRLVKQQKYSWKTNREGMNRLIIAKRLTGKGKVPSFVQYFDDFPVMQLSNLWDDTRSAVDVRYVVQTATNVIERCMLMCTDPGDLVLDPTCGSGTTAFVAEQFGRRWITIDSSRIAIAIAKQRLMSAKYPYYLLADSDEGRIKEHQVSGKSVPTEPSQRDIRKGFVYQRVPHVTLGSIAQNPDIKEGMSKKEIDAVIARNAEFELLYDKPFENNKKIRVAGRFTVESLSPHRALGFTMLAEADTETVDAAEDFNASILENLDRAGIQNGLKNERLKFSGLEKYAGDYVNAVGVRADEEVADVAIAIGPQYGTVSSQYIKGAVREAQKIDGVKLLCVLGFAFDPNVKAGQDVEISEDAVAAVEAEIALGKIRVVLVRMNTDLLMGDELKKTGSGNLFLVAGEPDIDVRVASDGVVVEILGVDVYDPNTEQVRSRSADDIALWMIDTNYNGESFFVRHCYFPGNQDWYNQLKRALKAEIDEATWDSLNKTVSRAFPKPETGQIAVKVINDYGDEVMKVIDVS
jgi:adenine-specific DNA-methyltransferase